MTRGRKSPDVEAVREQIEADLGELGTIRVYLQMAHERMALVSVANGAVLGPAMEYIQHADRRIRQLQSRIRTRACW